MKYGLLLLSLIISSSTLPKMSIEKLAKNFESMSKEEFQKELTGPGRKTAAITFANNKILELEQLKRFPQLFNYTALAIATAGINIVGLGASVVGLATLVNLVSVLISGKDHIEGLEQFGYLLPGCIGGLGLVATISTSNAWEFCITKIPNYFTEQTFEEMKSAEIEHYENFIQTVYEKII